MRSVELGPWRLPGLAWDQPLPSELHEEILAWSQANHCGTVMGPCLWSFRNTAQRAWFVLRWSDHMPPTEAP